MSQPESNRFNSQDTVPIFSMTGYGSALVEVPGGRLTLELRAVNHRFLDLSMKLPEDLRGLENFLREALQGQLQRGKVECRLSFTAATVATDELAVDLALVQRILAAARQIEPLCQSGRGIGVTDLLRWPGVLVQPKSMLEDWLPSVSVLVQQALTELNAGRAREGQQLVAGLLTKVTYLGELVLRVRERLPKVLQSYQERMRGRLLDVMRNAASGLDEDRVRQEVALYANRVDVTEELERLEVHLEELRRIVRKGGVVGKRLDFLLQELNREANTLASKSVDIETTQIALEAKVAIEQIREQIQNLE